MKAEKDPSRFAAVCLEIKDLWFTYGDGQDVLNGISLSIAEGDFVAVIGQNGSGKTTLAKHFLGLLRPTKGEIFLHGERIRDRSVGELARQVGYVFQNPDHQIFGTTTWEEIAFGPRNLGLSAEEVERRTVDALERLDLSSEATKPPAMLSFGQRRKVSLAAVYAMDPHVLILDEPTNGLDGRGEKEAMELARTLNNTGKTIILVTHRIRLVAEYARSCILLAGGRVSAYGDTRSVFEQDDLLRSSNIELPQVWELGRQLAPRGFPQPALSVGDFCQSYGELLKQTGFRNAGAR